MYNDIYETCMGDFHCLKVKKKKKKIKEEKVN